MNRLRATEFFGSRRNIERMNFMCWRISVVVTDQVHRAGGGINDGRTQHTIFAARDILLLKLGGEWCAKVDRPQGRSGCLGIEGIDPVVHGRYVNDIVYTFARNSDAGN